MAVGLKDIARATGVSLGTVSNILNRGREHLYSPQTREKVLECSHRLGYMPHRTAQSLTSRSTRVIGFVVANTEADGRLMNYGVYPFLVGMSHRLGRDRYHVAVVDVGELELGADAEPPVALRERFFDGLVVHDGLSEHAGRFAAGLGVPVIWWDSGVCKAQQCIYRDEQAVGRLVTRRLLELGHRRIAFLAGKGGWENYRAGRRCHFSYGQRLHGFEAEMRHAGQAPEVVIGFDSQSVADQLQQKRITAVVVGTPPVESLLQATQILNWAVPRDLSVAAFDVESRVLNYGGLRMGGVPYDRVDAGTKAAEMVLGMLANPARPVPSVRLLGEWRDGDTVAAAPAR